MWYKKKKAESRRLKKKRKERRKGEREREKGWGVKLVLIKVYSLNLRNGDNSKRLSPFFFALVAQLVEAVGREPA